MLKKTYQIDGVKFKLKEDLTVEESGTVQDILNDIYSAGEESRGGFAPAGSIKKFLSIVLQAENGKDELIGIDFGKAKESVAEEVVKDFFLKRVRLTAAATDYFRSLTKELNQFSAG